MATSPRIDDLRKKFDENPRRYFAPLANEYRKSGDLAQAIAICRQHLADQPGHMSGHIVYGQALFENKEFEEAQKVFTAALALDPENLIALRLLGDISTDAGDYAAARGWYQRVLDADPRNEDIQAQLKQVEEAEQRAVIEAARQPLPQTIVTAAVPDPRRVSTLPPTPATGSPVHEAPTMEMQRVPPPWAKPAEPDAPVELPPLASEDVAPPRLSIMGLDLESMARVSEADSTNTLMPTVSASSEGFETSEPFNSAQFDGEIEVDTNPLAGIEGIETRDESSAASLLGSTESEPRDDAFVITPPFGQPEQAATEVDLPPELHVPLRVTPPTMELGLAPQPRPEPTGLWDTLEDMAEDAAPAVPEGAVRASTANFEPPSVLFDAPLEVAPPAATEASLLPPADVFDLVDPATGAEPVPEEHAPEPEPFVTETMADLYAQQGHTAEALDMYRQLLQSRPGDAGLLGKIGALEVMAVPPMSGTPVRAFFAALAGWRSAGFAEQPHPADVEAAQEAAPDGAPPDAAGVPASAMVMAATSTDEAAPWMTARAFDLGVFVGAAIGEADEAAGRRLAAMYPDANGAAAGGTATLASMAVDVAASPAPASSAPTDLPGQPARPASHELSLDQVFGEAPPQRPSRKSASFSFDQFFSQTAQTPSAPAQPVPSAPLPAQPSPEEAEQFQNWLKGLKRT